MQPKLALHGGSNPSSVTGDHVALHIAEHEGKPQPAILARIAVEQEQKWVRLGTVEVPSRAGMGKETGNLRGAEGGPQLFLHGYNFAKRSWQPCQWRGGSSAFRHSYQGSQRTVSTVATGCRSSG